ncbi:MAG: SIR2 family protein, partial [Solirubrobacterales bacterium]
GHTEDWLRSLADMLIARHINVSIPNQELRRELFEHDPDLWSRCQRKFRCIAVVGAGASAPVLARGDDLASGLIEKFNIGQASVEAEKERLARITAVDPTEFEAQLSAIGQTLGNSRRVRAAISDLYRVRHPTVLAYELLAHLLKHRFLDAIISMNFDELLDQSLDDELGVGEYERIVSDRDCVNVNSDVFAPDYIPLYIKLHGTASEPESLRFTRESYYDSPVQVGTEAARLFQVPECVVLNIGFGMASFDLHRLLAIPDRLWLYNLSHDHLTTKARVAISRERENHDRNEGTEFRESEDNEEKWIRERQNLPLTPEPKEPEPPSSEPVAGTSDQMMDALLTAIQSEVGNLSDRGEIEGEGGSDEAPAAITLRPVDRHRAVVSLLGPNSRPGKRLIDLPRGSEDPRLSLDPLSRAAKPESVKAGYLLRRTILELALAMARGRGLVSIGTLAVDRCGMYYDEYRRHAGEDFFSWRDLYKLVGFIQDKEVPDVLKASEAICCSNPALEPDEKTLYKMLLEPAANGRNPEWHPLPRLDIEELVKRVLPQIVDTPSLTHEEVLTEELEGLTKGTEYELHSRDDRVCSKTFSSPMVLKTLSSLDAYSFDLAREGCTLGDQGRIDVISETGDWLLERNKAFKRQLRAIPKIRLIVAFLCDVEKLYEEFDHIEIAYQQPWHHNRHMAILRRNKQPKQAIYFARHHRTPYVTPVLVKRRQDISVLQTTFKDRWTKSFKLVPPGETTPS